MAMAYDGERAAADFRQQAQLAASLHRKNAKYLDNSPEASATSDEIVAVWSVFDYLAGSPNVTSLAGLLAEMHRMHAGERPEPRLAPVFDEVAFSSTRDNLLAGLIARFGSGIDQC
jgi:hypothetical protein